jgi:hypothetical protein
MGESVRVLNTQCVTNLEGRTEQQHGYNPACHDVDTRRADLQSIWRCMALIPLGNSVMVAQAQWRFRPTHLLFRPSCPISQDEAG